MRCENTQRYVCDKCRYETKVFPSCFPKCPMCEIQRTRTTNSSIDKEMK